jgi:hypothetical protein
MQTSNLALAAFLLAIPIASAAGCLDPGVCIRNSDCPSIDVCSQGVCILAPPDDSGDGGDEAGDEAGTTNESGPLPDVIVPVDTGAPTDAHADAGDAGVSSDAGDSGASDAADPGD